MRTLALAWSIGLSIACATGPAVVRAQERGGEDPPAEAETVAETEGGESGRIEVDETTGRRYRTRRPPEGLRRGLVPAPRWVPVAVGGFAFAASLALLAALLRKRARRRG